MDKEHISPNGRRVLRLMSDGKPRTTRTIIIGARVTDASREIRRLIEKGVPFVSEWQMLDGVRFKVWRLKVN